MATLTCRFFAAPLVLLAGSGPLHAAGLIVNEVSNGPAGSQEFFELLVVGNSADPTAPVDLDGWIIDDNNGDWEGVTSGVGISSGSVRLDTQTDPATCGALGAVAPGSMIVVYRNVTNPGLPVDDFSDTDGDGVYVFSAESACVRTCDDPPSTADGSYNSCATAVGPNDQSIALRNSGDVAQVRRPDGTLEHGFAYGNIDPPYPAGSFNVATGSGSQQTFFFSCGDWFDGANFAADDVDGTTGETPGAANNMLNSIFRERIGLGAFNYDSPADPANCTDPVVADLAVTKTLDTQGPYTPGTSVSYTIVVSNAGPDTAVDIVLDDTPDNIDITGVSGSCTAFPCPLPALAAGDSVSLVVSATVLSSGEFTNSATVDGPVVDTDTANNSSSVTATAMPASEPPARPIPALNAFCLGLLAGLLGLFAARYQRLPRGARTTSGSHS